MTLGDVAKLATKLLSLADEEEIPDLIVKGLEEQRLSTMTEGGSRVYSLSGQVQSVTTNLILLPDKDIAVFVMLTGAQKSPDYSPAKGRDRVPVPLIASDVSRDFISEFVLEQTTVALDRSPVQISQMIGSYIHTGLPVDRPEQVFVLQELRTEVRLDETGSLTIDGAGPFIPVGPTEFLDPETGIQAEFTASLGGAGFDLRLNKGLLVREGDGGSLKLLLAGMLVACLFAIQLIRSVAWPAKRRPETFAAWIGAIASLGILVLLSIPTFVYFDGWPSPYVVEPLFSYLPAIVWGLAALSVLVALLSLWSWYGFFWALDGRGFVRRRQYSFGALGLAVLTYFMFTTGMLSF